MTTAHCRTCDTQGPTDTTAPRKTSGGDTWHTCRACGSIDVDVMSPEGVAHELVTGDQS